MGEFFDLTEFAFDGARTFSHHFFQLVTCALQILLDLLKQSSEFSEFGFYSSQYGSYLACAFLYGECPESHLQTVQDSSQSSRSGYYNLVILL